MALYKLNMMLSRAFFLPLTVFEVTFRNRLCDAMSAHFNDQNWIINQKNGFMSHPSLSRPARGNNSVEDFLKRQVEKAEKEIKNRGVNITSGRIIAEQPLAFWVAFFNRDYYRVLASAPKSTFLKLPAGKGRGDVSHALNEIRKIRNRIFHHEPICFSTGHVVDIMYAKNTKNRIMEVLDWMDPEICLEFPEIHEIDDVLINIQELVTR